MDNDHQREAHRMGDGMVGVWGAQEGPTQSGRSESQIPDLAREQKEQPAAFLRGKSRNPQ